MSIAARVTFAMSIGWGIAAAAPAAAQSVGVEPNAMVLPAPLPPATMMEGFRYPVGTIFTVGYEDLGAVAGIEVEAREMRDVRGNRVRGLVIDVTASASAREQSLIDADEIPDLLKGIDALTAITSNPTQFKNFEMRYATRGELVLTASSTRMRGVLFAVEAGRLTKVRRAGLNAGEMQQLKTLIEAASQKLTMLVPDK